jgi:hypothetical protein
MTREHRQYVLGQTVIGAGINLLLNAAIGYLAYRSLARLPMSGSPSITGDLMVTAFLLPVLVCLIVTPLVRADARKGKVPPARGGSLPRLLPRILLLRAVVLGLAGAATIGAVTVWTLDRLGVRGMDFVPFVAVKAAFGAVLAAVVTPVVAWRALMDPVAARADAVAAERV